MSPCIRVLLVEDHQILRQGFRVLLEHESDITVIGEVDSGEQAIQMTAKLLPDVVVMDVVLPGMNGLEATRQIVTAHQDVRVLILTAYNNESYLHQAVEAGAMGYLLKHVDFKELISGIREIKNGNALFSPQVLRRLLDQYRHLRVEGAPDLSSREADVLRLIVQGKANKEAAAELGLSVKMVERLRQQLMHKLGLHDVASLTRYAVARGIAGETSTASSQSAP